MSICPAGNPVTCASYNDTRHAQNKGTSYDNSERLRETSGSEAIVTGTASLGVSSQRVLV
jgi:hypothetical protein